MTRRWLIIRYLHSLLTTKAKKSVVLYVANDNGAASRVYHRVGFVGLGDNDGPIQGVDQWLEMGLDRSKVTLGHW
jgi:RimJ/RimL family protein N-acetyltransferase